MLKGIHPLILHCCLRSWVTFKKQYIFRPLAFYQILKRVKMYCFSF
ncbi:hypothetical protein LDVICp169 [lymphocystis disease virus-China]|uniref:Uncharacterized protein n=1 Tax=lymphocystis disease virus-China TaxID=256729 RepID=Q677U3_9VIRU|nr:hypothetical protein LDVICp169 [lymphocystis disease virus-China]AAU11014.1 hypothetical protein [lymphocystis disease virus-China]